MPDQQPSAPVAPPAPLVSSLPDPTPMVPRPSPAKHHLVSIIIIVVVIMLAAGGTAFAYKLGIGPFKITQYTEDTLLSSLITKAAEIKTASYAFSSALSVNPRESGAEPFVVPAPNPQLDAQYDRDAKKMSAISQVMGNLKYSYGPQQVYDYKTKNYMTKPGKAYPAVLPASVTTGTKAADFSYAPREGGKNFGLTQTFETAGAISTIRKSYGFAATTTIISGQKVTFTKDSYSYLYLPSKPPQPLPAQLADSLRSLPPDISGNLGVGASANFSAEGMADWSLHISAAGDLGDLTYAIDAEALKKAKDYYVRVNKMPALFGSLANYKGRWIMISPDAASSSKSTYNEFASLATGISSAEDSYKKNRAEAATGLLNLAKLADTDRLFMFKSNPTKESIDGRDLYRYELDIRKEAIVQFYKDILAHPEQYKPFSGLADQSLLEYIQSKDYDDVFTYMKNNAYLTLWTDREGYPAIIEYRVRVVPPDTATQLKGKQIGLDMKLVFTNINKPVVIDAPKDATPVQTIIDEINKNTSSSNTFY